MSSGGGSSHCPGSALPRHLEFRWELPPILLDAREEGGCTMVAMTGADRVGVVGMQFYGRHGVYAHETETGQVFTVDAEMQVDLRAAGSLDDLDKTVNYAAVFQAVRSVVEGPPLKLIEAVAERIAGIILFEFPLVQQVSVRVHKQRAPIPGAFADVYCDVVRARGKSPENG